MQRDFSVEAPDRLWVADLSYLRCWEGMVFFAFVIDAFSRRVVGWQVAAHMRTTLVLELDWLPGHEGSRPVRVGNAASGQFQLDVYGEVTGVAAVTAEKLGRVDPRDWLRSRALIEHVERIWREPDDGIWEACGPRRHYTHSKVMAWLVFDGAIRARRALRSRRAA